MAESNRLILFKYRATNGISVLNETYKTSCGNYADAMDELLDYLEDFFKGGFDLNIEALRIYSDKHE